MTREQLHLAVGWLDGYHDRIRRKVGPNAGDMLRAFQYGLRHAEHAMERGVSFADAMCKADADMWKSGDDTKRALATVFYALGKAAKGEHFT